MVVGMDNASQIALDAFRKVVPGSQAKGVEVEEIEEDASSGHLIVTLGYWSRDTMPEPTLDDMRADVFKGKGFKIPEFLDPWRRKYKRVTVESESGKVISIKMYGPPLGVS